MSDFVWCGPCGLSSCSLKVTNMMCVMVCLRWPCCYPLRVRISVDSVHCFQQSGHIDISTLSPISAVIRPGSAKVQHTQLTVSAVHCHALQ